MAVDGTGFRCCWGRYQPFTRTFGGSICWLLQGHNEAICKECQKTQNGWKCVHAINFQQVQSYREQLAWWDCPLFFLLDDVSLKGKHTHTHRSTHIKRRRVALPSCLPNLVLINSGPLSTKLPFFYSQFRAAVAVTTQLIGNPFARTGAMATNRFNPLWKYQCF